MAYRRCCWMQARRGRRPIWGLPTKFSPKESHECSGGSMIKPRGLGRGLDALLGGDETARGETLLSLAVSRIRPGKYQPRTKMDQQALAGLAASVRSPGMMQPLPLRPGDRGPYELIPGEPGWRPAPRGGLGEGPGLW